MTGALHAKECVGPEVYQRPRPEVEADLSGTDSPRDILKREHERVLENLGLLRGAILCLKSGNLAPQSAIQEKGIEHLSKVVDFFDKDVGLHFRREEEVLFPALEKHIGVEKSPTRLLLKEHNEIWQWYNRLKEKLVELQGTGGESSEAVTAQIQDISNHIEPLLREHIKKENESLFPLARRLLSEDEIERISSKWKSLSVGVGT